MPYDPSEWLYRLAELRPADAFGLTPDILALAGAPPVPPREGPGADRVGHFLAVRVLPILAEDLVQRAALHARRVVDDPAGVAPLAAALSAVSFWADVRDWALTLAGPGNYEVPPQIASTPEAPTDLRRPPLPA